MRTVLLNLIFNAPDPCGFEKALPEYQAAWNAARAYLRASCPKHVVDASGTCLNCHMDTVKELP